MRYQQNKIEKLFNSLCDLGQILIVVPILAVICYGLIAIVPQKISYLIFGITFILWGYYLFKIHKLAVALPIFLLFGLLGWLFLL